MKTLAAGKLLQYHVSFCYIARPPWIHDPASRRGGKRSITKEYGENACKTLQNQGRMVLPKKKDHIDPKEVPYEIRRWICVTCPEEKPESLRRMAKMGGEVAMKHGGLDYKECVAEDHDEVGNAIPKMMKLKPDETVCSYIVFKLRAHRDRVNAKVMKEMENMGGMKEMPFDVKRMVYGGFKVLVEI